MTECVIKLCCNIFISGGAWISDWLEGTGNTRLKLNIFTQYSSCTWKMLQIGHYKLSRYLYCYVFSTKSDKMVWFLLLILYTFTFEHAYQQKTSLATTCTYIQTLTWPPIMNYWSMYTVHTYSVHRCLDALYMCTWNQ